MERIVESMRFNLSLDQAISEVGKSAFGDVIHRFDNLAGMDDVKGMFYRFHEGKYIELTDKLYSINFDRISKPIISVNGRDFTRDTVLLDAMGIPGDGEFHFKKILDMYIILHSNTFLE